MKLTRKSTSTRYQPEYTNFLEAFLLHYKSAREPIAGTKIQNLKAMKNSELKLTLFENLNPNMS